MAVDKLLSQVVVVLPGFSPQLLSVGPIEDYEVFLERGRDVRMYAIITPSPISTDTRFEVSSDHLHLLDLTNFLCPDIGESVRSI